MSAARGANYFCALHSVGIVFDVLNASLNGLIKRGPPAIRIKLGIGRKKCRIAACTMVGPFLKMVDIFAAERSFCTFFAQNFKLFGSKHRAPLLVGFADFIRNFFRCVRLTAATCYYSCQY